MLKRYDIVFVVLVYGNTDDLCELIKSSKRINGSVKFIVVNSYYDESSLSSCEKIAHKYNCDFLNVENKGYGTGNNRGIEYAKNNYEFDFLIVSNPDIVIEKMNVEDLKKYNDGIIGPAVITSTGKNQNPFYIDKKLFPKAEYFFLKTKNKLGYYSIIAINKIKKFFFFMKMKMLGINAAQVYAVHGSFIIFTYKVLKELNVVFDENIFLFCEEMVLAEEMRNKGIKAIYTNEIKVYHKEDGSMKFLTGSMYDEEVRANGYVLKKYFS